MASVSRSAVILRNITSNWIRFVVNAMVTIVLTPYVLSELGVARYGIWILTSSSVGYYGFLDLGFRAGVIQYLTRYLALRDFEKASDCISSAVVALSLLGVCVGRAQHRRGLFFCALSLLYSGRHDPESILVHPGHQCLISSLFRQT